MTSNVNNNISNKLNLDDRHHNEQRQRQLANALAQGLIRPGAEHEVMLRFGMLPSGEQWTHFFEQVMLWLGVIFCGSALIFFFAYNWDAMGKFAQFGLAQIAIIASIAGYIKLETSSVSGKACLLLASLLVGALLALVGQTYQTGADTYELFLVWAIAIAAWVIVAKLAALWLFWLVLINLAVHLYFDTFNIFGGVFGVMFSFGDTAQLWILFIINISALIIWEVLINRRVSVNEVANEVANEAASTWAIRVVLLACGVLITNLALHAVLTSNDEQITSKLVEFIGFILFIVIGYRYYRHHRKDVFALAGGILSCIVVATTFMAKNVFDYRDGGSFLLIALFIVAQSAAAAWWLKKVTKEVHA